MITTIAAGNMQLGAMGCNSRRVSMHPDLLTRVRVVLLYLWMPQLNEGGPPKAWRRQIFLTLDSLAFIQFFMASLMNMLVTRFTVNNIGWTTVQCVPKKTKTTETCLVRGAYESKDTIKPGFTGSKTCNKRLLFYRQLHHDEHNWMKSFTFVIN